MHAAVMTAGEAAARHRDDEVMRARRLPRLTREQGEFQYRARRECERRTREFATGLVERELARMLERERSRLRTVEV